MKNREAKWKYLYRKQSGKCAIDEETVLWHDAQLHHRYVHNSVWARRRFPLFIDSIWNLVLVDPNGHMSKPLPKKKPLWWLDIVERGLTRHPKHAERVNML